MSDENTQNIHAEDNSIAVGGIQIGGDVAGNITIGHGYTAEQVSTLITQISATFQPKPFDGRCPYKGLDAFEEQDADLFFGREALVTELIGRVRDARTVFITGPSGSGKSSLVRAGLIPALRTGGLPESGRWLYATMKPGRDPFEALALAFSRLKSPELGRYFREHAGQPGTLNECAESVLSERKDQRLVIFLDQFEEVFTQIHREEERLAFLNLLTHAASVEGGRVILLFSMRSDFVPNCATYPDLNATLNRQFIQIGAMQPDELVSAIAQPALRVGLKIDPDLIAQIINDMKGEPGALPLMQFALKDLFDKGQSKGGVIALTLDAYLRHGGIQKSLERHADAAFGKLDKHEQELARGIFSGLIEVGRGTQDTKRTAIFDELVPASGDADAIRSIVRKLADARLLTTDEQAVVTISHEKLIEAWPWLKRLVDENREVIALQNEITQDAKDWEEKNRDASYLYTGVRLAVVREKIKELTISGMARAFIEAGIATETEIHRKQAILRRRIVIGLVSFSAIVLLLLLIAINQLNFSRAQGLGYQAQVVFAEENYNTAALYAYQSNLMSKNDAANRVLASLSYQNFPFKQVLLEHEDSIYSTAWSIDGRLASGSADGTVFIWNPQSQQPFQILQGHKDAAYDVAWSTDGQLASASWDGTVIIWDLQSGQPSQILRGHKDRVYSVAWSADGQLASGSWDKTIIIWDLQIGQPAQTLSGSMDSITSLAWSVDGRLASGLRDNTVIIWDLQSEQPAQILQGHTDRVFSVAWSADGQLASGSWDNMIIIWDLQTGQPAQILEGHTLLLSSVAWSADGRLASGAWDKTIIIWDLQTGQPVQTIKENTDYVHSVSWSSNGHLASGGEDGSVILWHIPINKSAKTLEGHASNVGSVSWSTDGRLASGSWDKTVIIWDLHSDQPFKTLNGHTYMVTSVAWSADGQLASGAIDFTIIIWDLQSEQPAKTLQGYTDSVSSVAWSADGRLASGSNDNTIIIWDLQSEQPAQILQGHVDWVTSIAWSADGRLASASRDKTIIIWDLQSGKPVQTLAVHTNRVTSVTWSADGKLASGAWDKTIIIWDLQIGKPVQTFIGHIDTINSLSWSADGRLASGSGEGIIRIPRQDLMEMEPCDWLYRNMTFDEWKGFRGAPFLYKPACSNLPYPTFNNPVGVDKESELEFRLLYTWQGHVILLGILLLTLLLLFFILRYSYRLAMRVWDKATRRQSEISNVA